jgi:ribosomal protein S18 acetylase RimI-like enzyme
MSSPPTTTERRIRPAGPADFHAIAGIEQQAFDPARRSSRAALRRALQSQFQRVLVLELDGRVAGYLVLWPHRHTWRIYNLASDPAQRNRGVAGALLAAVAEQAAAAGARLLVLESREQPELLRFYEQRGFRVARRLLDYYGEGQHAVRMNRPLS